MAGPFQPYDPVAQNRSSPGSGSPMSPSGDGNPVSFRKNVNRAKTKRWVEAKQYSYDGDDWGDDDYDEYDDSPPPVPQPPNVSKTNGGASGVSSRHSSRLSLLSADRSRSTEQVAAVDSDGSRDRGRSAEARAGETPHGPQDSKPLPIVRPADIYKRMQENADQQRQSHDVARPDQASQEVGQSVPDPAPKPPGHGGVADNDDHALHNPLDPATGANPGTDEEPKNSNGSSLKAGDAPAPALPEVKGLSNFGTDVLGKSSSTTSDTPAEDSQRPPLQHNNSFGLQSAVHQAFDAPETPSSAVEGVSRSNSSDNTSVISPIIGGRPAADQKTPTIVEEPGENGSTPGDTPGNVPFKPGHRRDLSLPSSDNSPSRKPEINENEPHPRSANAEMSSTDPSQDYFQLYRPSMDPSGSSRQSPSQGEDLPAPLRPTSAVPAEQNNSKDSLPVIVPSMSRDNSPEDTENDRLRKEIIRSLSRENSPSDEPEGSRPETGHGDNLNPNQQYGDDQTGRPAYEPPKSVDPQSQSSGPKTFDELLSEDTSATPAPASEQAPKPKLTRRFSWESSSSEDLAPAGDMQPAPSQAGFAAQPPMGSDGASESVPNNPGITSEGGAQDDHSTTEKPKLSIIPPSTVDENSISDRHLPEVLDGQALQSGPQPEDDGAAVQALVPVSSPPPSTEPDLLGFRDILGIKSSSERVRSFNRTRDQFAEIDTGLNHWIRATVNAHPEHMDTVEQSLKLAGSAPKPSATRGKFPKLPSLGNLASSGPSGSLHVRRPSGHMMNRQQVEQRGKDLLHSAGVLGGRAGGAAKGFFAKGKSKFNRGGADKGFQPSRRSVHLPEEHPAIEQSSPGRGNQRRPMHLVSLPLVEPDTDSIWNPAPKRKRVSEAPDRRRSTRSASDTMINELGVLKTKRRSTSGDRTEASLTFANRRRQPSLSTDVIADNSARDPPCADDFGRELVEALGLDDVDSHPQQAAANESSTKAPPQANSVDVGDEAIQDCSPQDSVHNSRISDEEKTENNHHVDDQPQAFALEKLDIDDPAVKLSDPSDNPHCSTFPQPTVEASQQSHEPGSSKKTQLHENEGSNQLSPARSLSYASNATPSESLSHGSDGTLVVASKAVRAEHIRVVVNGVQKDSGEESQSAANGRESDRTGEKDTALVSHEHSGGSVSPDPSHVALGAEPTGTPGSQPGDNDGSTHLSLPDQGDTPSAPSNRHVHEPSVSSPGGSEKSVGPSLQQSQLAQSDESRISPPSEHADFIQQDTNRATNISRQPDSDSPDLGHDQPSHTRNGTSEIRSSDLVSPTQTVPGGFQKLSGMRVSPTISRNNLTSVAERNTENQSPKGQSTMGRLKNIGGLRRISLGGVEGPRKNAMNRLSGLFTRPGTFQQNKSEISPTIESHGQRSYSATENPNFANRFGEDDISARRPSEGRPALTKSFTPAIPPDTGHSRSSIPPQQQQQGQPGIHRQRHASMPVPPLAPPQGPPRGRFYARSQSPKPIPPSPAESNPSNSSSDRTHYPGITLPPQSETNNSSNSNQEVQVHVPSHTAATSDGDSTGLPIPQKPKLVRKQPAAVINSPPPSITITTTTEETLEPQQQQHHPQNEPPPPPTIPPTTEDGKGREEGEREGKEEGEREGEEGGEGKTNHPHRSQGRTVNETQSPVELPVGNDDSSEEIVMTSTAYPGQEWRPAGFGFGGEWE